MRRTSRRVASLPPRGQVQAFDLGPRAHTNAALLDNVVEYAVERFT